MKIDVERQITRLDEAYEVAREKGNPQGMVSATKEQSVLLGLYDEADGTVVTIERDYGLCTDQASKVVPIKPQD